MRINIRAFAWAAALVALVQYLFCAVLVALVPGALTRVVGMMIHADLSGLDRTVTLPAVAVGIVAWTALCAVSAAALAAVYNRAAR